MTAPTVEDVQTAIAADLDARGLAVYLPDDPYPPEPDLPAVFFGVMPEGPDRAVAVTVYDWQTGRDKHNPDVYVQLRWRGGTDRREVNRYADNAFDRFDEAERYRLAGGLRVLQSRRVVTTSAARDLNGRYERPESYRFTINPKGT